MKTIFLKVEVPDGRELIVMTRKGEGYQPITADFTEITLPTEEEIESKANSVTRNHYGLKGFVIGATWAINKMKGE